MQRVIDAFREGLDAYVAEACDRALAERNPFYSRLSRELLCVSVTRVFEAVLEDLEAGTPRTLTALLGAVGAQRSAQGAKISDMLRGFEVGFEVLTERFAERFRDDPEARLFWEMARSRFSYAGAAALADAFLEAREAITQAQAEEIFELSARVLPLARGVLLLPLVGRIDGARAECILEVLLAAVSEHGAKVVLLDVTGLPVVDEVVAPHLVRTASAVRLLGATPALVGVRPNLARTMVAGGVDLGGLVTLARLEDGLHWALGLLGRSQGR
ncbi:STAS domain-containing protein [Polyangium jinanense]|uniref:STAS domain-containing protein n=1 Tax=Polyangium jinanense TaxID=2829994 RepID=A0A9X4AUS7_9BACT|nr:STAS domain-containing protein [Polyangium jinanense]MDC3960220.1 STAS domain-containing protein [Polyangium jinanense]MDC3984936.1 STAS domain-containing protein [Polyangium jinanense]